MRCEDCFIFHDRECDLGVVNIDNICLGINKNMATGTNYGNLLKLLNYNETPKTEILIVNNTDGTMYEITKHLVSKKIYIKNNEKSLILDVYTFNNEYSFLN